MDDWSNYDAEGRHAGWTPARSVVDPSGHSDGSPLDRRVGPQAFSPLPGPAAVRLDPAREIADGAWWAGGAAAAVGPRHIARRPIARPVRDSYVARSDEPGDAGTVVQMPAELLVAVESPPEPLEVDGGTAPASDLDEPAANIAAEPASEIASASDADLPAAVVDAAPASPSAAPEDAPPTRKRGSLIPRLLKRLGIGRRRQTGSSSTRSTDGEEIPE